MDKKQRSELEYQLVQLLNGALNDTEMAHLRQQLKTDPKALDHYMRFVTVHAGMRQTCIHTEGLPVPDLPESAPTPSATESSREILEVRTRPHTRLLWAIAAAAALIAILIGVSMIRRNPPHPAPSGNPCATLLDVHQAAWASWTREGFLENRLRAGHWLLTQGLAKIKLQEGAELILHAPCDFTLEEGNHLTLHTGRVWVHVPPGAEGFSLSTRGAHLTDYGTEFGVIADEAGQTAAHVFVGSVGIRPASHVHHFEHRLTQGQATTMDAEGTMAPTTRAYPQHFVSDLTQIRHNALPGKTLDLADMVGGGNGFGMGRIDWGINPSTGQFLRRPLSERHPDRARRYQVLKKSPYIDGVFVPDASKGINIISSTHLAFNGCPDTDGTYYDGIFNGAKMSIGGSRIFHPGRLQGQAYGTSLYPALNIHTNAGITFDLDAIRASNPGISIKRFQALCGISETVSQEPQGQAEFWVLVDGKERFHYALESPDDEARLVNVKIANDERFLTLAATTVGNAAYNWTFFAEPILELTSTR